MTIQEVGATVGIITAVVYSIRWLLGFYFKKSTELENLKATHRSMQEQAISNEVSGLKGAVSVFRQELNGFNLKLTEHAGQLKENCRMIEIFQKQWERTAENLQERYSSLENADIVKVGENTFIFKTRGAR